ncbi:MAG: sterol desaturase family protein [Proteobacteria bacterium]|nr:sterol desaturase family protein [Pseudomonadota bacterium]
MIQNTYANLSSLTAEWVQPEFSVGDINIWAVLTVLGILIALERRFGCRPRPRETIRQSYLTNLGTLVLNDTLMSLLSVSSLLAVAEGFSRWGLMSSMADSFWKTLLSFILLDFTLYLWHRANHGIDCLWLFHKVHHSDRSMNVTTAFRLHVMEVLMTTLVKAVFIVVAGVDASTLLVNELMVTLFVMFHHANVSFTGEASLGRWLIVPSLHRLHHSALRKEHDRNYGAVLSWWDSLFGTLSIATPREIGLRDVKPLGILELVKFGFTFRYPPTAPMPASEALQGRVAEAAYYRAGQRGFVPGFELYDWLEAEKEMFGFGPRWMDCLSSSPFRNWLSHLRVGR